MNGANANQFCNTILDEWKLVRSEGHASLGRGSRNRLGSPTDSSKTHCVVNRAGFDRTSVTIIL
jgi:hypothetical protein